MALRYAQTTVIWLATLSMTSAASDAEQPYAHSESDVWVLLGGTSGVQGPNSRSTYVGSFELSLLYARERPGRITAFGVAAGARPPKEEDLWYVEVEGGLIETTVHAPTWGAILGIGPRVQRQRVAGWQMTATFPLWLLPPPYVRIGRNHHQSLDGELGIVIKLPVNALF